MSKIALVTGTSKGIGKALVKELIDRGWSVKGVARSEEKLTDLKNDMVSVLLSRFVTSRIESR